MIKFPETLQHLGFQLRYHSLAQTSYILPPLCCIPSGTFLIGSNPAVDKQAQSDEFPQHSVWLPAYSIGTYSVTVAEYACALQAHAEDAMIPTGNSEWWEKQLLYPTRPVYGLTWYDALAYTRWLGRMTGQCWRLPTEAQWEKSARGTDGRIYPWGNYWDMHNTNTLREEHQSFYQSLTSIDTYSYAASSYGVIDLVSNVSEWTSTIYDEQFSYPYVETDGREDMNKHSNFRFRVLRGGRGQLLDDPPMARAAQRGSFHINDRYDWPFGMRLVLI